MAYSIGYTVKLRDAWVLLLGFLYLLTIVLSGFLIRWIIYLLYKIPRFLKLALFIAIPTLFLISNDWIIPLIFIIIASHCGAAVLVLRKTGFKNLSGPKKVVAVIGIIIGFGGLVASGILYGRDGFDVTPITNAALSSESDIAPIQAKSPSEIGPFPVKTLTYGSGKDLHRPEYGDQVDLVTDSVNGLAFIDNWKGFGGWWREKYWGFDSRALPINARVWYPEGEGPFPLALIVHGNHGMQDYSDPGYAYLGELLASRGIILASVDENFINGSWSDIFGGLEEENDARGWLLLEHLKVWHQWNETKDHVFFKKIDTSNLALIGHSRGGEAVAHAAMFNKLPFYPDDASIPFDYNYNIKSIVAIAPVDGQYEPGDSRTKIEDVNYLVIHGAQDADVSSYMGSQQYERVTFRDSLYHFKAGVYAYGANHGQFNSSWGNNDIGNPFTGILNLKQLLPAEKQEQIAKVFISSFLDITLKDNVKYLPLFTDARKGREWLPETIYLSQFEDSNFSPIANFDEDFDVSTTTQKYGEVHTENLSVWREQEIQLKWQKKGSRALFVGWNYDLEDEQETMESLPDSIMARYTISLTKKPVDTTSVLVFSMAESTESADPKSEGKWVEDDNTNNLKNDDGVDSDEDKEEGEDEDEDEDEDQPKKPFDLTIELRDSTGQKASLPLSSFSPLQREIEIMIMKTGFIKDDKQSEKVFQTFYFPLEDFKSTNPKLDLSVIENISFVFNKDQSGVIVMDNIGFMKPL
ncbi:hypothetical protein D3A96_10215 [Robertkochia marina]|nr:hypothetical protein D3A96_10215 [Robertkochia marina]